MSLMRFQQTRYAYSCHHVGLLPADEGGEVVFMGRSNVGKSSLINALCQRKALARISRNPGRTQCFNVYKLTESARLVDCPGYGYAQVSQGMRQAWKERLVEYLTQRQSLCCYFLVMDARHPWRRSDSEWLEVLVTMPSRPLCIVLNKIDAVRKDRRVALRKQVQSVAQARIEQTSVWLCSCTKKEGIDVLRDGIAQMLDLHNAS